jgi:hypothetical protein
MRHDTPPLACLRGGASCPDHRGNLWMLRHNCLKETL